MAPNTVGTMANQLRSNLIRLAYSNPDIRGYILPLVKKYADDFAAPEPEAEPTDVAPEPQPPPEPKPSNTTVVKKVIIQTFVYVNMEARLGPDGSVVSISNPTPDDIVAAVNHGGAESISSITNPSIQQVQKALNRQKNEK